MSKKLFLTLSAATLLAAPISAARADLVLSSFVPVSGSGIGTQNTILTIQNQGTETGCVGRSAGGLSDFIGVYNTGTGACTAGANTDVKTGSSQTQTRTLAETGVTSASNFGVIFNAVENGGGSITLTNLSATFYSSTGAALYTASTTQSYFFPTTAQGQGNSGFLFVLDGAQQQAAIAAGAFTANGLAAGVRVGIGARATGAGAGNETFFVANTGTSNTVVPEPSTYALMAAGLLGVFAFARRRNRTA